MATFPINLDGSTESATPTARSILADVKAGTREVPTVDELLAELPVFSG